ncbi:hypothetical protein CYMTET_6609, partial [Cymbomonas tetramitiformis]
MFGSSFGASAPPVFGASAPAFGASAGGAFGASAPAFGAAPTAPAFGAAPAAAGFGAAPTAPAFGAAPAPVGFANASAFGAASPVDAFSAAFGATRAPVFGAATPVAFGAANASAFGAASPVDAASTPAFGATPAAPAPFPAPGSAPTAFGSAPSAFGGASAASAFGIFGSAPAASSATFPAFGASAPAGGGFGAPAAASPAPTFGATAAPAVTALGGSSANFFGAAATSQASTTPAAIFGAATAAATGASSASLFGAGTGSTGNSMLISLNVLFHSLRARHVPPGQPGAAGASISDAGTLLSQLEDWCHEPQTPLVTRTCEARRLLHATWGAAQRAVREALDGVEAGAAQLPEEVRRAVSSRDAARAEHTCGMEALLHTEERQWAAVVAQISGWRTVLTAAGGQPTQGEDDHSGVVAHGRAAALTARANDAVAAYRAWEQRSARAAHLAEESDRRVAALRTQLQELFDSSSGAPTYTVEAGSAALDAATWHAQTALEAEQHFREAAVAADPAPVEGLVAAGWAVLAELQEGEEAMQGGLVAVRAEIQELRRAQEDATAGCVAAAGVELRAGNRTLRRQRLHLGELQQVLARCQMDLEEQAEETPGEEVDRGEVDEAAARVATKKAEVKVAQRRLRAATCALVALGPQFPEVVYFLEHGVPPELLSLWRADCFLEDFAACSLSARQGSRHEVWQVRDSRGQEFAVKVYPITQGNPGALRALWREAALLHRMRHPGIVPILAIFLSHQARSTNFYGLQMPWYEHGQLDEWKAAQQPDEGAVRRGMLQVLEAVAHLHGNKVLHCDIKPANILVDASGRPHLLDFDISVDTATRTSVTYLQETTLRGVRGTDGYMAPELASTGPTTATDMYAYGMTFAAVAPADGQRGAELQELLRGLTAEDPGMRPSAAEACRHPYFAGVWEWQRTQMRVCCVKVELSTCGGAQHSLSDGVECSNRGGPAHFVCGRCLAA